MWVVHEVIGLYVWVLFLSALLSWFPNPGEGLRSIQRVFTRITEPVLRPLRAILPRPAAGGIAIDLSPLVAMLGLIIINRLI